MVHTYQNARLRQASPDRVGQQTDSPREMKTFGVDEDRYSRRAGSVAMHPGSLRNPIPYAKPQRFRNIDPCSEGRTRLQDDFGDLRPRSLSSSVLSQSNRVTISAGAPIWL